VLVSIAIVRPPLDLRPTLALASRLQSSQHAKAARYSNVVRILVPLVVAEEDLQAGLDILDGCLVEV
jgi:4-aminobutyrate aminotransferase-like enzyme